MTAKLAILGASLLVLVVSFLIGWWARRKVTSPEAFFGGAKIFGPLTIGLATMAAVGSAFAVVGVPGLVYRTGNTILLFMFAAPAFVFGYVIIGKKVRALAEVGPVASLGDLADLRFGGHRGIKLLLSVMLFLGCVMYLSAQVEACAKLFDNLFAWPRLLVSAVIFGILIAYTVLSGEIGGVLTQAFQGLVLVVAGLILIVAFFVVTGGFGAVQRAIAAAPPAAALDPRALSAWGSLPGAFSLAWVLLPTLGLMCQPQVLTRMFVLKDPRQMPKLTLYAVLSNMVAGSMVMAVGYCAIYLVASGTIAPLADADQAIFRVADHLGLYAQLVVYPAVLAAALSTSSLFLSLAGNIVSRDVPAALGLRLPPARQMTVSRVAMAAMGLLAIAFAAASGDMVAILGTYGFGTLTAATLPIFVVGLLWRRATGRGVMAGMVTALGATVACVGIELAKRAGWTAFSWPGGVPWYVNVLAASVTVTVAGSLLTSRAGARLDPKVELALEL